MGVAFKGDNRAESRETILGDCLTRILHDLVNKSTNLLASFVEEEAMSSKGKAIIEMQKIIAFACDELNKMNHAIYEQLKNETDPEKVSKLMGSIFHFTAMNQDMTKFTSIKSWSEY